MDGYLFTTVYRGYLSINIYIYIVHIVIYIYVCLVSKMLIMLKMFEYMTNR